MKRKTNILLATALILTIAFCGACVSEDATNKESSPTGKEAVVDTNTPVENETNDAVEEDVVVEEDVNVEEDADVEVDVDVEEDADVEVDVDVEEDADVEVDVDVEEDVNVEADVDVEEDYYEEDYYEEDYYEEDDSYGGYQGGPDEGASDGLLEWLKQNGMTLEDYMSDGDEW